MLWVYVNKKVTVVYSGACSENCNSILGEIRLTIVVSHNVCTPNCDDSMGDIIYDLTVIGSQTLVLQTLHL